MQDKIKRLERLISNLEKYTDKVKSELRNIQEPDNMTQCHDIPMDKRMPMDKFFSKDNLAFEYLVELKEDILTPESLLGDKIGKGMYIVRSWWKHVKCLQFFHAHNKKRGLVGQIDEIGYHDVGIVYRRLDFFTGEYKGKEYKDGVEVERKEQEKLFSRFTSLEDMGAAFNNHENEVTYHGLLSKENEGKFYFGWFHKSDPVFITLSSFKDEEMLVYRSVPKNEDEYDHWVCSVTTKKSIDREFSRFKLFTGEYKGKEYKNGVEVEKESIEELVDEFVDEFEKKNPLIRNIPLDGDKEQEKPLWYTGNDNWREYLKAIYKDEFRSPLSLLNSVSFTIEGKSTRVYSLNGKILNGWFNGKFYKDGKEI